MEAFEELFGTGQIGSIEEFLNLCSPNIQDELLPILEDIFLLQDFAANSDMNSVLELLESPIPSDIKKEEQGEVSKFPFDIVDNIEILEKRSIIDDLRPENDRLYRSFLDENRIKRGKRARVFRILLDFFKKS